MFLFRQAGPLWFGLVAPAGTPPSAVKRINDAVLQALKEPAVQGKLSAQGLFPSGTSPDDFAAQIKKEIDKMQRIARFAKISRDLGKLMHPVTLLLRTRDKRNTHPPLKAGTITNMDSTVRPMVSYLPGTCAVVLDSPHSGTFYPADFMFSCDAHHLRRAEDTHVEKLYDFSAGLNVHWVEAHFPRSYLDANRNTTEIDESLLDARWPDAIETDPKVTSKVRLGKGLIWRTTDDGLPIYDHLLSVAEVQARIANCWRPYHAAVQCAIDAAHTQHGYGIHINCHSMPAVALSNATDFPGEAHADFVVGDRDGKTASAELSTLICSFLKNLGYSVAYNHPYKGVELVRRYSHPAGNRHSIQLEINRKLYMNEETLEMTSGFSPLKIHLQSLVELLARTDPRRL